MKTFRFILLAVLIFLSSVTVSSAAKAQKIGDINGDDIIDQTDYLLIKRTCFGTYTPNQVGKTCADINFDGIIDQTDYLLIKRHCFGTYSVPENSISRLGDLAELNNDDCKILIIGNSFVGSSNIVNIANEMLENNQKSCHIEANTILGSGVSPYTQDIELMTTIKSGYYDAVLMCGLYGTWELDPASILVAACKNSGTKLIIFPAHNEDRTTIDAAARNFKSAYLLDWKAEIDALTESGIDKWELCINDVHLHSTPLAGYVGAHMLYRAIYNEYPEKPITDASLQETADELLGSYVKTGVIPAK